MLDALGTADEALRIQLYTEAGVKPIYKPYWEDLPYADPFLSITPDILHQLYQGVIKHLVAWVKSAYSEDEIDARCRRLPPGHHVRVFKKGITSLYQLTGREHADIARILLGFIIDMPLPDGMSSVRLVRAVRALLDFLYLAQYPVHTTETLALLDEALDRFHANKEVFADLGVRSTWCIPKLHYLRHYTTLIRRLGSPDNFNTEYTERLHIDYAKDAYEATNAKDEFPQMTLWLERREKILRHKKYIMWRLADCPPAPHSLLSAEIPQRVKMTKHPSRRSVKVDSLAEDYGASFFVDALARFVVESRDPELTRAQVEHASLDIAFPFRYDLSSMLVTLKVADHCSMNRTIPVYHKAKFWLGDSKNHRLSSNEYDVVHATPARKDTRGRPIDGQFDPAIINLGFGRYTGVMGMSSNVVQVHTY